MYMILAPENL